MGRAGLLKRSERTDPPYLLHHVSPAPPGDTEIVAAFYAGRCTICGTMPNCNEQDAIRLLSPWRYAVSKPPVSGNIVFRLAYNGEASAYLAPDMSSIQWSPAQKTQRQNFTKASTYAKLAIRDPEIQQYYVEMTKRRKRNKRRPGDMAVSDYFQGNDLRWKKPYGDQEKPADWIWKDALLPPVAST